jgi:endonuclease YncB( thermonuclease family)
MACRLRVAPVVDVLAVVARFRKCLGRVRQRPGDDPGRWLLKTTMFTNLLFLLFALAAASSCAVGDDRTQPYEAVLCSNIYVHDGDTITADLSLPFRITLPNRSLRAFDYDAWEVTRTRQTVKVTDAEIKKGEKAREALQELLKTGTLYIEDATAIQKVKPDPYGRMLTVWWVQQMSYPDGKPTVTWVYVPRWMEQHGHIRTPRDENSK